MTKSPAARRSAKKATKKTYGRSSKKAAKKAAKKTYKKTAKKTYKKTYGRAAKETEEAAPFYEASRLMAIAINASQNLAWRAQSQPNGPWVTDWAPINTTIQYDAMVAGMSREGRVIALGHQRPTAAVHFYIQSFVDDSWEGPVNLALPPGVPGFSQLATARSLDGLINVFGIAKDTGIVWWIKQNPETPTPPKPWGTWQQIWATRLQVMTAANSGDGTIVLAGSAFADATVHTYYTRERIPNAKSTFDWLAWVDMTQGHLDAGSPALRLGGNILNIFAIGGGSDVVQTRQLPANSNNYTPWAFPAMVGKTVKQITTGIDGDGHIVIAAQDDAGKIYVNYLTSSPSQQYSGWQQIGERNYPGPMTLDYNADGRLTLFMREATGDLRLWCISQIAINSTTWEADWTVLSLNAVSRYGIARDLTP
jgi:hypothetical protein